MPIKYNEVKTVNVTLEFDGFVCDKCEEDFEKDDFLECQEMFHYVFEGGYGSHWDDGSKREIALCSKCSRDLMGEFSQDIY